MPARKAEERIITLSRVAVRDSLRPVAVAVVVLALSAKTRSRLTR